MAGDRTSERGGGGESLRFTKGQALGNDYLAVDAASLDAPLAAAVVRALCDRHRGAGSDGVLLADLGADPVRLRIFNPDGTEAEKSGNGLRIFAAYLHDRGVIGSEPFPVELMRDRVRLRVDAVRAGGVVEVIAEMGRASFRGEDVGFEPRAAEIPDGESIALADGTAITVQPVSLANPHCVVFVDELERAQFLAHAPELAVHPAFAAGTNVQFARVAAPTTLEAWIFERGAGETLASGSSACAVAAAALRQGRVEDRALEVRMPGGSVHVRIDDDGEIELEGPAQIVYRGEVPADVVAGWRAEDARA